MVIRRLLNLPDSIYVKVFSPRRRPCSCACHAHFQPTEPEYRFVLPQQNVDASDAVVRRGAGLGASS